MPVYNDEKSLNKLLVNIDKNLNGLTKFETEVIILDDKSFNELKIQNHKFNNIKSINILSVKENLGSQKIIAVGLNYLKIIEENFFVTIMDSDGEDNPDEIERMLKFADENKDFVITSNRKSRRESILIKILYKIHLLITFLFSFQWISFGNFSTFNSINIKNILKDRSSWLAHSSSVIKNCKIKRLYARRQKRYFDKSKLGLFKLVEHSIRVNAVFSYRVLAASLIYSIIIYFVFSVNSLTIIFFLMICLFNILILLIKFKHSIKSFEECSDKIEKYKSVKI